MSETVAVVVVTHNRADLLVGMLDGLAAQTRAPDRVIVIDNGSTDHTGEVLSQRMARTEMPLDVVTQENLGGAGGFHRGVREAYAAGFDRIWLMDDDVVPAPGCLAAMLAVDEDCLIAVREDLSGWKGFYMYRNLFVVHLRHGENALVRLKPWLITLAVVLLSPLRGGRAEARNVIRAMASARGMRRVSEPARPPR